MKRIGPGWLAGATLALLTVGCASLEGLRAFIQPPRFEQTPGQRSEIRLNGAGRGLSRSRPRAYIPDSRQQ